MSESSSQYDWDRDTWKVIDKYFAQHNILAQNQIGSYNDFVDNNIPSLIKNHNPIEVGDQWDADNQRFLVIYEVEFGGQPYMSRPQINEGSGSIRDLYPKEARHRGLSYSALIHLDVTHRIKRWDGKEYRIEDEATESRIPFKLPAMLHSKYCYLEKQEAESLRQLGECPYDKGGYFIVNGSEKVIISQERPVENKTQCYKQKVGSKFNQIIEVRSTVDQRYYPVRNNAVILTHPKEAEVDQYLRVNFPYLIKEIPLMIVFRALEIVTDEEILEMILGCPVSEADPEMLQLIKPSLKELVETEIEVETGGVSEDEVSEADVSSLSASVSQTPTRKKERRKIQTQKVSISTPNDALLYIARNITMNLDYLEKKLGTTRPNEDERRLARAKYVKDILRRDLLPHMGEDFRRKAIFLGYMTHLMLLCKIGDRDHDVRDHYANKRDDLAGPLLKKLFQGSFGRLIKDIKKEITSKAFQSGDKVTLLSGLRKVIQNCNMEAPIKKALSTGDWSTSKNAKLFTSTTLGIAQVLQRPSYLGYLSYLRRVQTPMEKAGNKITEPRKLDPTQFGYVCPNETPEGQQVGIVKNLAMMASVTISSGTLPIKAVLKRLKITPLDEMDLVQLNSQTKVFLNGEWLGCTTEPSKIYKKMKLVKRQGGINPKLGIYRDFDHGEIHLRTDGGRYTRPVYVVEKIKGKHQWLPKIAIDWGKEVEVNLGQKKRPNDMSWHELVSNGYVEFIDPQESENCMIAFTINDLLQNSKRQEEWYNYTHLEIHPSMMQGVVSQMIPFSDHNQSPRNCYQSSMGKQAMGMYVTNPNSRFDTMANSLCYPQKPLVATRTTKYCDLDKLPHGHQAIVAVASYTGYNQEDSVLMNQSGVDRGLFNSFYMKTYVDEMNPHKSSTAESEVFGKPDPTRTQGVKHDIESYRHLDENGFVKLGSKVDVNDIIIGKTVKLNKPIKNYTGQQITHTDISTQVKQGDDGYVDMRIPGPGMVKNLNADNNQFCKVRIAQKRNPVIGDKIACYDPSTEILTSKGWKSITKVTLEDRVATLVDNQFLKYEHPTEFHEYDNDGEMYQVKSQQVDLCVTKNHRMYIRRRDKDFFEIKKAEEIIGKRVKYKKDAVWAPKFGMNKFYVPGITLKYGRGPVKFKSLEFEMEDWLTFLGIWFAEGWTQRDYKRNRDDIGIVQISANKPRVKKALDVIDKKYDFLNLRRNPKSEKWHTSNVQIYNYLRHFSVGAINKSLPKWVWGLMPDQSRILLEGMMLGDGHKTKIGGCYHYYTSSKQLADDVQRLSLHAGWSANIYKRGEAGTQIIFKDHVATLNADALAVTIVRCKNNPQINHGHCKEQQDKIVPYNGKVYCVTVPSGIVYVRRNGVPVWCGNSRQAQKGTVGLLLAEHDMPFTESGMVPDLVMNPHALPSRMTVGQMLEVIYGKAAALDAKFMDATPFTHFNHHEIGDILESHGFQRNGEEVMYNGFTGEKFRATIFIGPVYYQRLKHMVKDKVHARATGRVNNLTRQSVEGRTHNGGLRMGEELPMWCVKALQVPAYGATQSNSGDVLIFIIWKYEDDKESSGTKLV